MAIEPAATRATRGACIPLYLPSTVLSRGPDIYPPSSDTASAQVVELLAEKTVKFQNIRLL